MLKAIIQCADQAPPARKLFLLRHRILVCFAEKMDIAQVNKMVDKVWQARLATGDPLEALLHKEEVKVNADMRLCLWCMLVVLQLLTASPDFLPLCCCTGGEQD